jgi:hypothetical protein
MQGFEAADRRHRHRQAQVAVEEAVSRIDLAGIAQHARAQRQAFDGEAVAAKCRLGLRRAGDIVPDIAVEPRLGGLHDLVQGQELGGIGGGLAHVGVSSGTGSS